MAYRIVYDAPAGDGRHGEVQDKVEGIVWLDGLVKLTSHAVLAPFGPGDLVRVDGDLVTGVELYAPIYTYEVDFYLPADLPPFTSPPADHRSMRAVAATIEEWEQDYWVTRTTNYTALVSALDDAWLQRHVVEHRFVEHAELIRTPSTLIDYNVAIRHPDLAGTGEGPWA